MSRLSSFKFLEYLAATAGLVATIAAFHVFQLPKWLGILSAAVVAGVVILALKKAPAGAARTLGSLAVVAVAVAVAVLAGVDLVGRTPSAIPVDGYSSLIFPIAIHFQDAGPDGEPFLAGDYVVDRFVRGGIADVVAVPTADRAIGLSEVLNADVDFPALRVFPQADRISVSLYDASGVEQWAVDFADLSALVENFEAGLPDPVQALLDPRQTLSDENSGQPNFLRADTDGRDAYLQAVRSRRLTGGPGLAQNAISTAVESPLESVIDVGGNRLLPGSAVEGLTHLGSAIAAAEQADTSAALEQFAEARRLRPSDAWGLIVSGLFEARLDRCSDGIQFSNKAVLLAPANGAIQAQASRIKFLCGRAREAITGFDRAGELGEAGSEWIVWRAMAELADQRLSAAHGSLERYLSDGSRRPALDPLAALAFALEGETDSAYALVDGLRSAAVGQNSALVQSIIWMAEGDYLAALRDLRAVTESTVLARDWPLLTAIQRNAWFDPALNEPAFRLVRASLELGQGSASEFTETPSAGPGPVQVGRQDGYLAARAGAF